MIEGRVLGVTSQIILRIRVATTVSFHVISNSYRNIQKRKRFEIPSDVNVH